LNIKSSVSILIVDIMVPPQTCPAMASLPISLWQGIFLLWFLVLSQMPESKPPAALDAIADVVLAYRPKPKSKPAKKRKRRANKIAKDKAGA
jgi:hypothetical protein